MSSPAHERGFTLVELLVVIIIIGILSAIAVPVFLHQRTKAQDATLKSDILALAKATETFYADGFTNADADEIALGPQLDLYYRSASPGVHPLVAEQKAHPQFPSVQITNGTGLLGRMHNGGFCVLGNRIGSSWYQGAFYTSPDNYLYYDSLLGGIRTRSRLNSSGACASHA